MTQKKTYRIHQINRLLQEEIASIMLMEIQDEQVRALTLTDVQTTRDLSHALVFVTTHKEADREDSLNRLNDKARLIRKVLYSRLRLKRIPELEFRYDDTLDKAEKIFQTLEHIHHDLDEEVSDI